MNSNTCARAAVRAAGRVLVVDDIAAMRLYLSTILSTMDLHVAEAEDGGSAFDRILSEDYDLVITDLMMEPIDGFQLISAIAALPEDRRRPTIIVCTSQDPDSAPMRRPELQHAAAVLPKPVEAAQVVQAVSEALGLPGAASQG